MKGPDMTDHNQTDPPANVLDTALKLADAGYRTFPCLPLLKEPAIKAWQNHATAEPKIIRGWFSEFPDRNLAIATGPQPNGINLLVIDIDVHHGGLETWKALIAARGGATDMRDTPTTRTPHGGFHIFLNAPGEFRNTRNRLGTGIDTRCAGGYVLVPPSVIFVAAGEPVAYTSEAELWSE
jgi:hypothetical protein